MVQGKLIELDQDFKAPEGYLELIYGRIGSGKTLLGTMSAIRDLQQGNLVYTTWPINVDKFDDRKSFWHILKNIVLFRSEFYHIDCPQNLHYINFEKGEVDGKKEWNPEKESEMIEYLNKINHAVLYIDESWRVLDSYSRVVDNSVAKRNLILVTRHKFRRVVLIAQRPTSIQATARSQVAKFYKCVKLLNWPWPYFAKYEFQDMVNENVDEDVDPVSVEKYWGSSRYFNAYNSYYYGELKPLHNKVYEKYEFDFKERFLLLRDYFLDKYNQIMLNLKGLKKP